MKSLPQILIALSAILAGCDGDSSQQGAQLSPGAMLATIDAGHSLAAGDPAVQRMEVGLSAAEQACGASSLMTAEKVNVVRGLLKDKGVQVSNVELVEMLPKLTHAAKISDLEGCIQLLSIYGVLRTDSKINHLSAMDAVRLVFQKSNER